MHSLEIIRGLMHLVRQRPLSKRMLPKALGLSSKRTIDDSSLDQAGLSHLPFDRFDSDTPIRRYHLSNHLPIPDTFEPPWSWDLPCQWPIYFWPLSGTSPHHLSSRQSPARATTQWPRSTLVDLPRLYLELCHEPSYDLPFFLIHHL